MKKSFLGISFVNWLAAILLLLLLIIWLSDQQGLFEPTEITVTQVAYDPGCDLRAGPCLTTLEDGSTVSFGIEPRTIPVAKTLNIEVKVTGREVEAVTIDLKGVNMKMPPNRVNLEPASENNFKGQTGLMFCTLNAMEWETVVELTTEQSQVNVPFRFITVRDGSYSQ